MPPSFSLFPLSSGGNTGDPSLPRPEHSAVSPSDFSLSVPFVSRTHPSSHIKTSTLWDVLATYPHGLFIHCFVLDLSSQVSSNLSHPSTMQSTFPFCSPASALFPALPQQCHTLVFVLFGLCPFSPPERMPWNSGQFYTLSPAPRTWLLCSAYLLVNEKREILRIRLLNTLSSETLQ